MHAPEDPFEADGLREAVRAWLDANAERSVGGQDPWRDPQQDEIDALHRDCAGTVAWARSYQRRLFDAGFAGLAWPREYGGRGFPADADVIYQEEIAGYFVPRVTLGISLNMVRHVILMHGTDSQRQRFLLPLLRGDEIWCQLFSEPGAGSDLAGLQSRAIDRSSEFVLNGQKVWTSGAQYADYGLLLARTNVEVPKHAGITAFLLDMRAPGISVRPLRQATGVYHFNEVFFDEVVIPACHVIGRVDDGWRVAITTLMHERGAGLNRRADLAWPVIAQAREFGLSADPLVRQHLADLWIRSQVVDYFSNRLAVGLRSGQDPSAKGSLLKLAASRLAKEAAAYGTGLAGPAGVAWSDDVDGGDRWAQALMATRRLSIAGGTDEIMRNIVGERLLGLPKDPGVDKDRPFKDLLKSEPRARQG